MTVYLLFCGANFYPSGGTGDLVVQTLDEKYAYYQFDAHREDRSVDWAELVSVEEDGGEAKVIALDSWYRRPM